MRTATGLTTFLLTLRWGEVGLILTIRIIKSFTDVNYLDFSQNWENNNLPSAFWR